MWVVLPIQDYLAMGQAEAERRIPFVWAVDANARLLRLVVSRELTMACRDRLNWWHTLQELAGVRSAEARGNSVVVSFEGSVNALLRLAIERDVVNVNSREADLEQIFLEYYHGNNDDAA